MVVKKWAEEIPPAEQVGPGQCSKCGAASQPPGQPLVLVSHDLRERQVRGPSQPNARPETRVVRVRRYRCHRCGGLTTVLPRGLTARRHYSASSLRSRASRAAATLCGAAFCGGTIEAQAFEGAALAA